MSRFLGILLMLATGAVFAELIAGTRLSAGGAALVLTIGFMTLGLLLGVLATARQWLWAVLGSAAAVLPLLTSGKVRIPPPEGDLSRTLVVLAVPMLALMLGTVAGRRFLEHRLQARSKPEHDD
ncbi:MAG: hypothetical protein JNL97_10845 [Verrucomicrobiales bacterium]|nr:hypothetical protein [Verrucomicrobiales bacterium]